MPRRALAKPLYRDRSGVWYADLRRFSDVGGKRHSLGTSDRREAERICRTLVAELEARRLAQGDWHPGREVTLGDIVGAFLVWKWEHSGVSKRTLEEDQRALEHAIDFYGQDRLLQSIRPADVERWISHMRRTIKPMRGGEVAPATLRNRIKPLSGLYAFAQYRDLVQHNPVRALASPVKPRARLKEATFLQPADVALVLEAVRLLPADEMPHQYAIVATLALTGGRRREVLGTELQDVDFEKETLTFRPNQWRVLKTPKSHRVVPLWPQLKKVLEEWLYRRPAGGELLFPSTHRKVRGIDEERMYKDLRTLWDRVNDILEWKREHPLDPERITSKVFRNSYAAARLQTLNAGQPIAMYEVARELGHSSLDMLNQVYGHLGNVRHRKPVVEFQVDHYGQLLKGKLESLKKKLTGMSSL